MSTDQHQRVYGLDGVKRNALHIFTLVVRVVYRVSEGQVPDFQCSALCKTLRCCHVVKRFLFIAVILLRYGHYFKLDRKT